MVFLFGSTLSYWAGSEEVTGVVPYSCGPLVGVKEYLNVDVFGFVDYFTKCFRGVTCYVKSSVVEDGILEWARSSAANSQAFVDAVQFVSEVYVFVSDYFHKEVCRLGVKVGDLEFGVVVDLVDCLGSPASIAPTGRWVIYAPGVLRKGEYVSSPAVVYRGFVRWAYPYCFCFSWSKFVGSFNGFWASICADVRYSYWPGGDWYIYLRRGVVTDSYLYVVSVRFPAAVEVVVGLSEKVDVLDEGDAGDRDSLKDGRDS